VGEAKKLFKILLHLESRRSICDRGFSHLTTTLGAPAADFGASFQLGVVNSQTLAVCAAPITYIRTDTTDTPIR
jgi:hypothetical protein